MWVNDRNLEVEILSFRSGHMMLGRSSKMRALAGMIAVGCFSSGSALWAADVVKDNNTNNLNLTTSWVGGIAPTNADVAVWNATVAAANTTLLGANTSWQGIRIADPT